MGAMRVVGTAVHTLQYGSNNNEQCILIRITIRVSFTLVPLANLDSLTKRPLGTYIWYVTCGPQGIVA